MSWLAIAELPASKVQSVHSSVAAAAKKRKRAKRKLDKARDG